MATATPARAFFHVGLLDEAEEGLREVITAATAKELPTVAGDSMIRLGMLLAEKGRLADAERQLLEAEKLFRTARYRRKLVEAILQLAALRIEMAEIRQAEARRYSCPRKIQTLKSSSLSNQPGKGIVRTRQLDNTGPLDQFRKSLPRRRFIPTFRLQPGHSGVSSTAILDACSGSSPDS